MGIKFEGMDEVRKALDQLNKETEDRLRFHRNAFSFVFDPLGPGVTVGMDLGADEGDATVEYVHVSDVVGRGRSEAGWSIVL